MKTWIEKVIPGITIDNLPESYQAVAEIIGVEGAIRLSQHLGGLAYYFPKLDNTLRRARDDLIRSEFTGFNHRALARAYGLTEMRIREIVQIKTEDTQTDIFDLL
jgi:Mor family transcriptional regulator